VTTAGDFWQLTHRADERAFNLYKRHYSAEKNFAFRKPGNFNFVGPGFNMVLLTEDAAAVFVWVKNNMERFDKQVGVCCTIFRNETRDPYLLSSDLIREADALADVRWPGERHFTYVNAQKTAGRRSRHAEPGQCFLKAGWRSLGLNRTGRLVLLERQ
jgi:hypothetical protein